MKTVTLIIRKPDATVDKICIPSKSLGLLVTNHKLYEMDVEYINYFIVDNMIEDGVAPLPSYDGIIVIDMITKQILDAQDVTGINKMTPMEYKMSAHGKTDETDATSVIKRFSDLINKGYLKGFENWHDNGIHLNTDILKLNLVELIQSIMKTNSYGQFIFKTDPFKITEYFEYDYVEQLKLFQHIDSLGLLNDDDKVLWLQYLKKLKH